MGPSSALASLRPDLGGAFMEFPAEMDALGYIANQVLPFHEVALAADTFGIIPVEEMLKQPDVEHKAGTAYNRDDIEFAEGSYATSEKGTEKVAPDSERKRYRHFFDLLKLCTRRGRAQIMRAAEIRAAALVFNTTTWTGAALTTAASTAWSTHATGTVVADVAAACKKVWDGTGLYPNALIVNRWVYQDIRQCASIIARIESGGAGGPTKASDITPEKLAEVFDLDRVIVAGGAKNSADEGAALSIASVWGNLAMVAKVATSDDIEEPCIGRCFHWSEDGAEPGGTVEQYREERVRGEVIRVRHEVQEKILYVPTAHLITGVKA